jgi:hypothetical protein
VGTGRFTNLTKDIAPLTPGAVVAPIGFSADGADVWFKLDKRTTLIPLTGGTPRTFLGDGLPTAPGWSI